MMTENIPQGYVLVPANLYEKFIRNLEWVDIEEPTMSDVESYLNISSSKIRLDMKNIDCPLRSTYEGGKGKGNEKRFLKSSVEHYKNWLIKK